MHLEPSVRETGNVASRLPSTAAVIERIFTPIHYKEHQEQRVTEAIGLKKPG